MIELNLNIINKLGLHARASAKFVSTASRYQSRVQVIKDSQSVDGKSIMGVMMLAAKQGSQLLLKIEGPDEKETAEALSALLENRFGEAE